VVEKAGGAPRWIVSRQKRKAALEKARAGIERDEKP
jgi:hypothetical protein